MKTHALLQLIVPLACLTFAPGVRAACIADAPEIGDIGPDSERVCTVLDSDFPGAGVRVYDRQIHSPTHVVVLAEVDGETYSVQYRLQKADWVRYTGPCLTSR
jgi:hypothetical protein